MHRYSEGELLAAWNKDAVALAWRPRSGTSSTTWTAHSDIPWEVLGEFRDILSGKDDDRPQLTEALRMARAKGAELLVSKLDRLSRDVEFIARTMKQSTIRVATMPQADPFQMHIYAALAEEERKAIGRRTKAALQAAKARGKKLGGLRDATMKRNEAIQVKAKREAERVHLVAGPMREAGQTLANIADALNAMSVTTSRGGQWTPMQVKRVLDRVAS